MPTSKGQQNLSKDENNDMMSESIVRTSLLDPPEPLVVFTHEQRLPYAEALK